MNRIFTLVLCLSFLLASSAFAQREEVQAYIAKVSQIHRSVTPAVSRLQLLLKRESGLQGQKARHEINETTYQARTAKRTEWLKAIADMRLVSKRFRALSPVPTPMKASQAYYIEFANSVDRSMTALNQWVDTKNSASIPKVFSNMNAAMSAYVKGANALKP